MLRIFGRLTLLAAIFASGFYFYDIDRAKCDQICVAESAEEP
jgi:hypothetical protein